MLHICLCDDDKQALDHYADILGKAAEKHALAISLACFESAEALLFHLSDTPYATDILFLDIFMGKTSGMEAAKKLRSYGCTAEIIFLTSSEDYVYEAFDVQPLQYLLKEGLTPARFEEAFLRAADLSLKKQNDMFYCEFQNSQTLVPFKDIAYFEIWKRVVTVHLAGGEHAKFYGSLEQLHSRLPEGDFIRVHRSYLVHMPYIQKFQRQSLILKTGAVLPIGVTYIKQVRQAFSDYLTKSHFFNLD